jgi:hypothetical protein
MNQQSKKTLDKTVKKLSKGFKVESNSPGALINASKSKEINKVRLQQIKALL